MDEDSISARKHFIEQLRTIEAGIRGRDNFQLELLMDQLHIDDVMALSSMLVEEVPKEKREVKEKMEDPENSFFAFYFQRLKPR